jgi:sugar fermentation stimulation protein A
MARLERYSLQSPIHSSGVYLLLASLPEEKELRVGRLGRFRFPEGFYVYTGSALGGLAPRIERHLRGEKTVRWHIDYLLEAGAVSGAYCLPTRERWECELNARVAALPGATVVAPGFGSSDCPCRSHLHHFERDPTPALEALNLDEKKERGDPSAGQGG